MTRAPVYTVLVLVLLGAACSKNADGNETIFYGTWVKGSNPGDTLFFMKEAGKNMLRYPASLTAAVPVYKSAAYSYQKNTLKAAVLGGSPIELSSFNWVQRGKSFSLSGNDLYPYLSSIVGPLTFTKLP